MEKLFLTEQIQSNFKEKHKCFTDNASKKRICLNICKVSLSLFLLFSLSLNFILNIHWSQES